MDGSAKKATALRKNGMSLRAIAIAIRVSHESVRQMLIDPVKKRGPRIARVKQPKQPRSSKWTTEIEAKLGIVPDRQIAEQLGVSASAVWYQRRRRKIAGEKRHWTTAEDARLRVLCRRGKTDKQIAADLGCDWMRVFNRRKWLGILLKKPRKKT